MIAVGNRMSRKTAVVEALLRQAITEEAIRRKQDAEEYRAEKRAEAAKAAERAANGENEGYSRISSRPQGIQQIFAPREEFGVSKTEKRVDTDKSHDSGVQNQQSSDHRFADIIHDVTHPLHPHHHEHHRQHSHERDTGAMVSALADNAAFASTAGVDMHPADKPTVHKSHSK